MLDGSCRKSLAGDRVGRIQQLFWLRSGTVGSSQDADTLRFWRLRRSESKCSEVARCQWLSSGARKASLRGFRHVVEECYAPDCLLGPAATEGDQNQCRPRREVCSDKSGLWCSFSSLEHVANGRLCLKTILISEAAAMAPLITRSLDVADSLGVSSSSD